MLVIFLINLIKLKKEFDQKKSQNNLYRKWMEYHVEEYAVFSKTVWELILAHAEWLINTWL